jgi:hypothetical protein
MAELRRSAWGPATWAFLHTSAAVIEDVAAFQQQLRLLTRTLPCPECRGHTAAYLAANPPEQSIVDAETASRYVYAFHNAVNERLGKARAEPYVLQLAYSVALPELQRPNRLERVLPYRRF